ncbi:hypothetical protein HF329_15725 [Chitinophaga oryzae]|uniref:Uncharacterized protein n=1 Tax=Chitinophaga oryzae TaxID=2725414 RepID=A0AAE6ZJT0_9BACT|nr:hypothetical protein [Chitinophaga oryzae]QJB32689.1 hypothetical protein HF329_15725 [Chitinophaga oryzae]
MKWIDTTHIRNWAQRRDCQEHLPLLVRKLIRSTSDSITSISFPSGENVLVGGWDGILEVYEETDHLPLGLSVWEFGANSDIKGKADGDYAKRTAAPLGVEPKNTTYIFVTPRLWKKKQEWADAKNGEGIWKEVKVYDAQDLEEWIELAPTVGSWLAVKHLGILPSEGIQPTDDFWEEWSTGNRINFVPEVVLSGRIEQSKTLIENSASPDIIAIQGNSREEALAFIVATFLNDPLRAEDFFSRSVIIDSVEAFRKLLIIGKPLYLICRFDDDGILNRAKHKGHTIIVPIGLDRTDAWSDKIILPPLQRDAFVNAMVKSGMTEAQAEELSKKSARNLIVVRRQLDFKRLNPQWSLPENVNTILPAILAGRWNEDFDGDRKMVAMLAGEDYEVYIKRLQPWCFSPDAPVVKIGSNWRLTSPMDAWTHAARYLTKDDFKRLAEAFLTVLTSIDQKFDLSAEDRHKAGWYGIKAVYSRWLREGLIESLILTSLYNEKLRLDVPDQAVSWVDGLIYKLLNTNKLDLWRSLDHDLSLIAEASPNAFTTCVEDLLKLNSSPIIQLFEEEPGYFDNQTYYTGLLWALEGLAWMPEYLSRVVLILGQLSEKDPGGKSRNRPINSLYGIFRSGYPQTFAPLSGRIDALRLLQNDYQDVGWTILIRMLPEGGRSAANHIHKMKWRLSDQPRRHDMEYEEIFNTYKYVLDLLLENFNDSEAQFIQLIDRSINIEYFGREKLLDFLEERMPKVKFVGTETRDTLRKLIGHHRSFPTADWSLPENVLKRYEKLYESLEPEDDIEKVWWLFANNWPQFLEGKPRSVSRPEQAEELQQKRNDVLNAIYAKYGFGKLLELVDRVGEMEADILGFTLANVIEDPEEINQLANFLNADDKRLIVFQSFLRCKYFSESKEWVFSLYGELRKKGLGAENLSKMFLKLRAEEAVWGFIENTKDQTLIDTYWASVDSNLFFIAVENWGFVINKLIHYKRFASAIYCISYNIEHVATELIVEVLQNYLKNDPEPKVRLDSYDIDHLFEELEKRGGVDNSVMISLEWMYMPILGSSYGDTKTPRLSRAMAEDPDFFIEVLSLLYKPEVADGKEDIEDVEENKKEALFKQRLAEQAFSLLYYWKTVPGVNEDKTIDEWRLNSWVNVVRKKAEKSHRLGIADDQIGKILAEYPEPNPQMKEGIDFSWPPEPICNVIDSIGTRQILCGFSAGCYNKRGSSMRGPFDGGIRERHLTDYFTKLATKKASKYPKVAAVFEGLARGYANEAKREDERAERDRLDY